MGDSSASAVLAEVSHWWSSADHSQTWGKRPEVPWDLRGPWVLADLCVPSHPAFLAGH